LGQCLPDSTSILLPPAWRTKAGLVVVILITPILDSSAMIVLEVQHEIYQENKPLQPHSSHQLPDLVIAPGCRLHPVTFSMSLLQEPTFLAIPAISRPKSSLTGWAASTTSFRIRGLPYHVGLWRGPRICFLVEHYGISFYITHCSDAAVHNEQILICYHFKILDCPQEKSSDHQRSDRDHATTRPPQ
jgi:hypothetical protein